MQPNHPSRLHNLSCCNVAAIILFVDDVDVNVVVVLVSYCSRLDISVSYPSVTAVPVIVPCSCGAEILLVTRTSGIVMVESTVPAAPSIAVTKSVVVS